MRKFFLVVFLGALFGGSFFYFFKAKNTPGEHASSKNEKHQQVVPPIGVGFDSVQAQSVAQLQSQLDAQFVSDFQKSAVAIEQTQSETLQPGPPYGAVLSQQEMQWLAQLLTTPGHAMRERIFAALRLSDHPNEHWPVIREVLSRPRQVPPEQASPHSEGEFHRQQEGALRIMLIDALIESVKKDPSLRGKLSELEQQLVEPSEREYLKQRMSELSL